MKMFGFFYYSKKQKQAYLHFDEPHKTTYCKTLFGKVVEYTEWRSRFPFTPFGAWDDYKLVGIGFFHHFEKE